MPKLKYKKIDYIKKVKKEDKEEEVYIPEFLSKREYKQYVEFKNSISK
jgi:deoxyinosine 3'endonuclease (endonuclease V)